MPKNFNELRNRHRQKQFYKWNTDLGRCIEGIEDCSECGANVLQCCAKFSGIGYPRRTLSNKYESPEKPMESKD